MESTSTPISEGGSVIHAIISAVANAEEVSPTILDPLYETVDPDALDALLERAGPECEVTFQYESYTVTVSREEICLS